MENKLQKIEMTLIHRNFVLRISIEQFFFSRSLKRWLFQNQYNTKQIR